MSIRGIFEQLCEIFFKFVSKHNFVPSKKINLFYEVKFIEMLIRIIYIECIFEVILKFIFSNLSILK